MRIKEHYSLSLDELIAEVPNASGLPTVFDGGLEPKIVRQHYSESLNICKAFANYLVERNRTKDMAKQFAAEERALDARNYEERQRSRIIIANYAERLEQFLEQQRQALELETQASEAASAEIVSSVEDARAKHRLILRNVREQLRLYSEYIDEVRKFIAELEDSPEQYVLKNRYCSQLREDCRIRMKWINDCLKQI